MSQIIEISGIIEGLHNGKIKIKSNNKDSKSSKEYLINILKYKEVIQEDIRNNIGKKAIIKATIKKYSFTVNYVLREGISYNLKELHIM